MSPLETTATGAPVVVPAPSWATSVPRHGSCHDDAMHPRLEAGWARLRGTRREVLVLAGLVLAYTLVFGVLTWRQQSNFGTFGFDMGIFDQGIWLLSRFHDPFVT